MEEGQKMQTNVCGYNLTSWEDETTTTTTTTWKRDLGTVLYIKKKNNDENNNNNYVKKKGKIIIVNNVVGIQDVGNTETSKSLRLDGNGYKNNNQNFFINTSVWMEEGQWLNENETKNICDNCEINEVLYTCEDCNEYFCKRCCETIHKGGKRRNHDYYEI